MTDEPVDDAVRVRVTTTVRLLKYENGRVPGDGEPDEVIEFELDEEGDESC